MASPLVMLMETGVPALIIGGCAAQLYGYARFTKDADCAIATGDDERMHEALAKAGYKRFAGNHLVARYRHKDDELLVVDTLFVSADTFAKMWALKRDIQAGKTTLTVASPMIVSALKLHALKQDASRLHDMVDIIEMLRRDRENWTLDELKETCARYGPPGIFEQLKPHFE